MDIKNTIKWTIATIVLAVLIFFYRTYNPYGNIYFPKCLFKELTGYKCPGCGSQRGIYYMLNLDIINAMRENIILVISIPYILIGFAFDSINKPNERILKWRKTLFGRKAIFVILSIIIGFWIIRNITYFQ